MSDAPRPDNSEPTAPPPPVSSPARSVPAPRKQRGLAERIFRAGLVVFLAHAILKILALVLQVFLSQKYGLGWELDTYSLVFGTILTSIFLTGEEALGPAFLPTFMALKDGAHTGSTAAARMGTSIGPENGADGELAREFEAWGLARTVLLIHGLLVTAIILVCVFYPEWVVKLWLTSADPGDLSTTDPQALLQPAAQLLRLSAGALIGWSLGSLTYLILNSYKVFFWAALGDSMLKVGVIFAVALFSKSLGYQALGIGVTLGGLLKLALHLWGLRKVVGRTAAQWNPAVPQFPRISFTSPGFKEFCWLLLPLSVGILLGKVRDRFYAAPLTGASRGVLTAQKYGKGLFDTIGQLIPYALSIAMYPFFCDMVDRGDRNALGEYLTKATRMVIVFFVGAAIAIWFLAEPASAMLFYRDSSEAHKIAWIAISFRISALALPAAAVEMFQMQAYFSSRKIVHAQVIGIAFSTLAISLTVLLTSGKVAVWFWHLFGMMPHDDVALIISVSAAFTIVRTLKVIYLGRELRNHLPVYPLRDMAVFFLRLAVMAALAATCIWAIVRGVGLLIPQFHTALDMTRLSLPDAKPQLFSRLHLGGGLLISGAASLFVMYLAARICGLSEITDAVQFAKLRVQGWRDRRKGNPPTDTADQL
ncbi:MAG TPA: lipid II flippase MurJ [Planctomycetota bacterium]|nr:lipid II flippase MurJ [Planctomycetota bacterium]